MNENKRIVFERWNRFLKEHSDLEFNPDVDIELKAETCAKYGNVCPCLPRWRLSCPCSEALDDIEEADACYCMVFRKKGKKIDLAEHSKMTKKVREKLGIGKKKS